MHKLTFKSVTIFIALNLMLFLFFADCARPVKKNEGSDIKEINIMEAISSNRTVKLSTVASSIEYCMLETDEKCLITPAMSVYCAKDHIVTIGNIVNNRSACYVFDRKTGKFVRQISGMGQGPGEYTEVIDLFWDEKKEQICVWTHLHYLFYNLDGSLSHQTNRFNRMMDHFVAFEDFYVGYIPNNLGNETVRVAFYDKTGKLTDSIPNYRSWIGTPRMMSVRDKGWLYSFRDTLYFKEIFCDTLYRIKDFTIRPRYIFNTGGRAIPDVIQEGGGRYDILASLNNGGIAEDRYEKYVTVLKIFEDSYRLYFAFDYRQFRYPAVYNKAEDTFQVMSPVSIPPRKGRDWKIPLYGFENDLDGGLPFWPQQMVSENEMMCVYTAEELLALDASKITDAKLKKVLNSLKEDSNPVVAIVALKDRE
jgi:hypothetical protein